MGTFIIINGFVGVIIAFTFIAMLAVLFIVELVKHVTGMNKGKLSKRDEDGIRMYGEELYYMMYPSRKK